MSGRGWIGTLVGRTFLLTARPRLREIEGWKRNPVPTQERLLLDLVRKAQETCFGREHAFASIRSVKDFQSAVPLHRYLDFKPYWDRLLQGETGVTWPGHVQYFALTSGTTAGNKFIPVTKDGIASQKKAGRDLINFYLAATRNSRLFGGKFLFLGGSTDLQHKPHDALAGDLSGIMTRAMPWYTGFFRLPGPHVAFMADWEKKLDAMAREAEQADVRGISGTPSWMMVLFDRVMALRRARGQRAETLADVWPNLEWLIHGGVNYEPYRESVRDLVGKPIKTMEVYPASEGFIAIQDRLNSKDLLTMMDVGLFFEFVPVAELDSDSPRRFTVADAEIGVDYAIVLSTNSGAWAYILGDTVRFTCLRPHRLRVTGRTAHFLSAFGEHLIVEEVEQAMTAACRATGAEIRDFHVAPLYPDAREMRPGHQWLVEFSHAPTDRAAFAERLDAKLQSLNDDYAAHRQGDVGMRSPIIESVPANTFFRTMKVIGKLGGQNKVPRLRNDREFADEILKHTAGRE